jgi:hypothetical protein
MGEKLPQPGRAPDIRQTAYGDCLEYLIVIGVVNEVSTRLVVRRTSTGGLLARIERVRIAPPSR